MGFLLRFAANDRGNIAVIAGVCATVLIGMVAFAVDQGSVFTDRRRAQSIADLAALAAASNPAQAAFLANATVARNGIKLTEKLEVQTGTYVPDGSLAAAARFLPGPAATADAVRVQLKTKAPIYFGKIFSGRQDFDVQTTATAANTKLASFSIGSRLASLNGGVLNQLLSQTLGGSVSLSVMDYQSLADLHVDMFDLLNAVATEAKVTGPTYDSILSAEILPRDAVRGLKVIAATHPSANATAISLLDDLERAAKTKSKVTLGSAVDPGPYRKMSISQKPAAKLDISALDVLAVVARIADGSHQVDIGLDLDVPGIAKAAARLTIGERPVSSGWTAVGRSGATVETAQTRIALAVTLLPASVLAKVELPIYVDIAKGKATLTKITCPGRTSTEGATLAVTPGIAEAWIGEIPASPWTQMLPISPPAPAAMAKIALVKVTGKAHVLIGNQRATNVTFSTSEIRDRAFKTVRTSDYLASLTSSLLGDLKLGVAAGSIGVVLPGQETAIKAAISAAAVPIDNTIYTLLSFLGVGLGEVDVRVDGVRCDGAVLVN